MTRSLDETLAWAGDGAAHLRGLMARMGDDAFAAPSGLPGWSRAHVLSHVARNADAMINLLRWARTGEPTPAYASVEARDADIEAGATRPPAAIRDDVVDSSDRLAVAVREMPEKAWSAQVRNVQGTAIPATDIPWIRAREMWIHAVDLDVGASLADLPVPMLVELIGDVVRVVGAHPDCPPLRLVASDAEHSWVLGDGSGPELRGPAASLAAWALGRSRGKDMRTSEGHRPPVLPRWL
ncbi:maleylpyruvate isomerase family mycothiol-dependent enzyme [Pseudonocardia hydrocarbonoxydans]|uniref:Maleylpyruvate isomerase n=1 Tax=Pseudonocardia hydrocarbonoxydans TaxID=76726 RepID=A0A4Y3WPI9_9PSEU|nr:maleylpyruvate isomerase family mycothiol-dependent enzyme [Pseudonocardia hydrocarbonoxydans]GEC19739.1 maleylpyruvate isomerase [Pseudonocardia hydrocarbonoxydans]